MIDLKLIWRWLMCLAFVACSVSAEVQVGTSRDVVIQEWGLPKSKFSIGAEETFIYDNKVRVFFKDGKIVAFKNRDKMVVDGERRERKPVRNTGTIVLTKDRAIRKQLPTEVPDLANYEIPNPSIITEPTFRAKGTSGGESDGRTIGVDGRPLADHSQYARDTGVLSERLNLGLKGSDLLKTPHQMYLLRNVFRGATDEKRAKAEAEYKERFNEPALAHALYDFAALQVALEDAYGVYHSNSGQVGYKERLKVKDRINLNGGSTPAGRESRRLMKESIWRMEQIRGLILKHYGSIYDKGRFIQQTEHRRIVEAESFGKVVVTDAQMFLYQKFENTPMLVGLQHAVHGRTHTRAKPLLLPLNAKVQVLERLDKVAPKSGGLPETKLELVKVKLKDPGVRQLDGASLNMTMEGWTLARNVK